MAQSFEQFLAEWRKQSVPRLTGRDVEKALLETRGNELRELAISKGFREQLTRACRPYRSMGEFVRALDDASHHHGKQNDKDGS